MNTMTTERCIATRHIDGTRYQCTQENWHTGCCTFDAPLREITLPQERLDRLYQIMATNGIARETTTDSAGVIVENIDYLVDAYTIVRTTDRVHTIYDQTANLMTTAN